jgi:tetratricopeptide (TPR) repeat protein
MPLIFTYRYFIFSLFFTIFFIGSNTAQSSQLDSLLSVLKTHIEDTNKVLTLKNLCSEYRDVGEYKNAISYANRGLSLGRELNFKKGISFCYSEIGLIHFDQSNFSKALEYHYKALKINSDSGDKRGIAKCFMNIGIIHYYQSNFPKALEYYIKSLKIDTELADKSGISGCYTNIGLIHCNQSNFPKALEYYYKALKINSELGDKRGKSACYMNIGNIHDNKSNYPQALEYFTKSLKIDTELGDKSGIIKCYTNIGLIHFNQNNFPKALEYLKKALKIETELGDKSGLALLHLNFSSINNKIKQYSLAIKHANEAILLSKEVGEIDNLRLAHEELAIAQEGLGNYKDAYLNHKVFKEITDSIFNIENSKQLSDIKTNYEVEKRESELKVAHEIEQTKINAQIQQQKLLRNGLIIGFATMLVLTIIIYRSYRQKQTANNIISQQKEEVEKQRSKVEHQNREILSSIEYAKRIQATILPPSKVVKKHLKDSFILYLPKDIVAGDFYWMETVHDDEEIILFAACDSTGHGVPGALVSVVCSNALNRSVNEYGITNPALILDKVSELVVKDFSKDEYENVRDGMDTSLCAIKFETGELQWAGANIPLWIIRNGELIEIKADKQPIGKMDKIKPFTNHIINLQKGDIIYLSTDGYTDQFGGVKEKKYSKKAFRQFIVSICHLTLSEQKTAIYNEHNKWRGDNEQIDDICIFGVKI